MAEGLLPRDPIGLSYSQHQLLAGEYTRVCLTQACGLGHRRFVAGNAYKAIGRKLSQGSVSPHGERPYLMLAAFLMLFHYLLHTILNEHTK